MSLKGRNLPKSARRERFVERFLKHHKCIVISSKYSEISLRKTAGAVGKERLKQTCKAPDRTFSLLLKPIRLHLSRFHYSWSSF